MPSTNGNGPKRAILYARVSTDEQARNGYSLAQQLEALREYAANLSADDPFVRVAADLPISPGVRYHSIIARADAEAPLEASDDGLVPYRSAHLAGAVSEKVVPSGHSVQETPEAILEVRRILHLDLGERRAAP